MARLTREALLQRGALPRKTVKLPVMGEEVLVQGLTGAQRDQFEGDSVVQRGKHRSTNFANMRARLVVLGVIHDDGQRVFTDSDAAAVGNLPAADIDVMFDAIRELSGMSSEDVEELGKPLPGGQPGFSPIASSETSAASPSTSSSNESAPAN